MKYPLSVLKDTAEQNCLKWYGQTGGSSRPVSFDAVPKSVTITTFDKFGNNKTGMSPEDAFQVLPPEIDPNSREGDIVEWQGKQFVVLENNEVDEELCLAPAGLIATDH